MEWSLEYSADLQAVSAQVTGDVTVAEADAMLAQMLEIAESHSARRFLIDHSRSSFQLTLKEILARAKHYDAIGFKPQSRFAIVFGSWTTDSVLLEAAIAHDYSSRVFVDSEAAVRWLVSASP